MLFNDVDFQLFLGGEARGEENNFDSLSYVLSQCIVQQLHLLTKKLFASITHFTQISTIISGSCSISGSPEFFGLKGSSTSYFSLSTICSGN